jgi:hypothetical protein
MLAMISIQLPEDFITLLQAHIYMVCPTAIPSLPKPSPDCSEVELMESLGMIKDKHGTFESFERFLARTEVKEETESTYSVALPRKSDIYFSFFPL